MALFISYSSQDRSTVDSLTTALRRGQNQVWFDQELGGGDSWWAKILEQIRECEVFIVALSSNWLQSKPSQAELRYAQALGRPILPVRIGEVDSMRVNPLAALQIIDYREPTVDAGIQLVTAVHALRSKPVPLPDPLPPEPPVPFGYITRLGNTLAEKELSPQQQLQLLVELRSGFDEDGDDPSARGDIAQLLRMLRLRHDVTYRTRSEIDNVLAEIEAKDGSPGGAAKDAAPAAPTAAAPTGANAVTVPTAVSGGAAGGGSNKRLLIIGGAAVAVIAAIAIVVVMTTQSGKTKPAPKASNSNSAPTVANSGPSAQLDSYLLGPADVGAIVNDPNLVVSEKAAQLRNLRATLSIPDCKGAYEPIEETAYKGADGYVAVSGQAVHTGGENPAHRLYEAVAKFASPDAAAAFVRTTADKWKACAGQSVTVDFNGKSAAWKFGEVTGTVPRIYQERTEADGTRVCHHALHAASSVVVDLLLCGPDAETGQAGKLAGQIAARVSQ
ncbi:serine/threonine-protein kinase [Mycobacterium lentiflavum]|uniref:Sensor domain-containing protein n=1 Tax=Mycobacterium lentiflavum TaxID=141349 RepID=A0A0E4H1P6_MYCLN|nr:sensor domain-containing protein [Mycobacterium lentiflavum]MEE3064082.1 sensor domain-containing protein [Actinomycetota bacterium]ULP41884.1 sensor domain-containing protein [Mycobacterium lentiflavum]CQD21097.1 serine/threonine-protein kinase [Mycobacterium lentiflavum]